MKTGILEELRERGLKSLTRSRPRIAVGMATCGLATGAQEVYDELASAIAETRLDAVLTGTGCLGFCQKEPLVDLFLPGFPRLTYAEMTPEKARELVVLLRSGRALKDNLLCRFDTETLLDDEFSRYDTSRAGKDLEGIPAYHEVPFFARQRKIALRNCGFIDPDSIEEYVARGGYFSLLKVLTGKSPEQTIDEVKQSGLRGRGGAGFLTGRKWELCRSSRGDAKYLVCNADEGDPGAYMDRSVLEGDPHSVLDGMLIGGYAIGAAKGFVYARTEYPLAISRLRRAIEQAREHGLLGKDVLGTGFSFDIEIREGSGAFVCGEETSLMHSIEGVSPEPRQRPPFPAESGLWGCPTNINNVETWANVPAIMLKGGAWYAGIGTGTSTGTKVFSLVGKVENTGLVEVPMGTTLREIIFDIGGGIPGGKRLKAVQTGGPSGGCIPASLIDLPVDYEKLAEVGSIMGSGGMVVMDEDTCIVDIAKYFLSFTNDESCGKCTSCREGSEQLLHVLTGVTEGKGQAGDIEFLQQVGEAVRDASQCGLGQNLPNPLLSTLTHFRDEYDAHVKYKRCPAVVCRAIISSPCQYVCPIHQNVPAYISYLAAGDYRRAAETIRIENPLPLVCGRVCHHPCERKCRARETGDPIAIRALKRVAADYELQHGIELPKVRRKARPEKVAIVGAGPAGLTCAYYLALDGYGVTVFDALPVAGGMLGSCIPEYRLPRDILRAEIDAIRMMGVAIETGTRVANLDELKRKGFQAVFVATGAWRGLKMGIPGEDSPGVFDAVEFLTDVSAGRKPKLSQRLAVIGGGNAAIDSARTALRLGCESVAIIYRRTRDEMPADAEEIRGAIEEGVRIEYLAAPTGVLLDNGRLCGIRCVRMRLDEADSSGRPRPVPVEGSEFTVEAENMIYAIGQEPNLSFLSTKSSIRVSRRGTIEVDPVTLATAEEGVFAGGDVVSGPASVVEAMAAGKTAARSIDKYLRGEPVEPEYRVERPAVCAEPVSLSDEEVELIMDARRPGSPTLPTAKRTAGFSEVVLCLDAAKAVAEARRCLRCDRDALAEEA